MPVMTLMIEKETPKLCKSPYERVDQLQYRLILTNVLTYPVSLEAL